MLTNLVNFAHIEAYKYMSKLYEIEGALLRVDQANFQALCDALLFYTQAEFPHIDRTGSAVGKAKTIKGTPDTCFQLSNGKFVMVEYTTQSKASNPNAFLQKVENDIESCLDERKTGVPSSRIDKLIYCCNSKLLPRERKRLTDFCVKRNLSLELKTLDTIALSLLGKYAFLAQEFLQVSVDTFQILPPEKFVDEYERSGYATPLHHPFLFREKEVSELSTALESENIILLTGPPGVGKTKLALGAFSRITQNQDDWQFYCIANKSSPIHADLRKYLPEDNNYVVLIDDANRQLHHLNALLGLLKEKRKGRLVLLLTVRDYAYQSLVETCREFNPLTLRIEKLSDEQIGELIGSDTYEVRHPNYVRRILEIADGNPRLAVMAAVVARKENNLKALSDVSHLYDSYFENAVNPKVYTAPHLLKAIGILSFFHFIHWEDTALVDRICTDFEISKDKLREGLEELEDLELVETSADKTIVRLTEQVLGTYFFYLTFFRRRVLRFTTVLTNYFDTHLYRIRDTVIPANNTFGPEKVYAQIDPYLTEFWPSISANEDTAFPFLDLFWMYRQDTALAFVQNKIDQMPPVKVTGYSYDENSLRYSATQDRYLKLLAEFFHHPIDHIKDAIDLSIQYVQRKPEAYSELVKSLRESFAFRPQDEIYSYYRQNQLLAELMKEGWQNEALLKSLVFDVLPSFMRTSLQTATGGRKRNTFVLQKYQLSLGRPLKAFRRKIWQNFYRHFDTLHNEIEDFLFTLFRSPGDRSAAVHAFDWNYLERLFNHRFQPASFVHCYLVQEIIYWLTKLNVTQESFEDLKKKFSNQLYRTYRILRFDFLRDRYELDLDYDFREYQELKTTELRNHFSFSSLSSFQDFFRQFQRISSYDPKYGSQLNSSLDIILSENMAADFEKGLQFINYIIEINNPVQYNPTRPFYLLDQKGDNENFLRFYNLIVQNEFAGKDDWLLNCFAAMPARIVDQMHVAMLLTIYKNLTRDIYIEVGYFPKFAEVDASFYEALLEIIYVHNKENGRRLTLDKEFFLQNFEKVAGHPTLLKKTYLQQQVVTSHFDYQFDLLLQILQRDPDFLLEYINFWSDFELNMREHHGLHVVWELPEAENLLEKVMDCLVERNIYHLKEDFANVFFDNADANHRDRQKQFLEFYLFKSADNFKKVNAVFDCVRHRFSDHLEYLLTRFLDRYPDFEVFKQIDWTDNYFFGNGGTYWGDVKAGQYQTILQIIDRIKIKSYRFAFHKEFIRQRIEQCKRSANEEQKRKFMHEDW